MPSRRSASRLHDIPARLRARLWLAKVRRGDPDGVRLAERVVSERLTFLELPELLDLRARARAVEREAIPGVVVEAGCALGGSAIMLASGKDPARPMYVHDVFGMIPAPSERDGHDVHERYRKIVAGEAVGFEGDVYYGYREDLKASVAESFARVGYPLDDNAIELVEGLFQDTLNPSFAVALGHVDGDWYESVKVCLERLWPALSPGGALVIDDYDAWSGCRLAVDEFLRGRSDVVVERWSRLHLVKADAP